MSDLTVGYKRERETVKDDQACRAGTMIEDHLILSSRFFLFYDSRQARIGHSFLLFLNFKKRIACASAWKAFSLRKLARTNSLLLNLKL